MKMLPNLIPLMNTDVALPYCTPYTPRIKNHNKVFFFLIKKKGGGNKCPVQENF